MKIKRFSQIPLDLDKRIKNGTDQTLTIAEDISNRLLENETLGKTKGVKRWGNFVKDLSKVLKKRKNVDSRK